MTKKQIKNLSACLAGVAMLSACAMPLAGDDELEVFVGDQHQEAATLTEEDYKIIQDQRDYMAQYYDYDISTYGSNPDNKQSAFYPDSFVALPDGSGYVGYVDLGLPSGTKWAVMNVGSTPMRKDVQPFGQYFNRAHVEEPDLEVYTHVENLKEVMPYNDYIKLRRGNATPDAVMNMVWDEYLKACKDYVKAFEKARDEYCDMLMEAHFAWFTCPQRYVLYGSNTIMKKGDYLKQPMPPTLSGADNDAATNLWGSHWATPSREQFLELITPSKTTGISVTYGRLGNSDDCYGTIITGRTGKKLFLPWAASCNPDGNTFESSKWTYDGNGYYMLNARESEEDRVTTSIHVSRNKREYALYYADNGVSVRPVYRE